MRNALVIARRELGGYFKGSIGYIYMIVFLGVTNFLGIMVLGNFFGRPVADMRSYFQVMVGVSVFFVAAITMRLWAEERKENTYEMLLTFPMKSAELVLGKYLAGMVFYGLAVAGTLTVPWMMAALSHPEKAVAKAAATGLDNGVALGWLGLLDPGPVLSGYLGIILVGSVFISFGLFISGFCRDQIVAFVITTPVLLVSYLLGIPMVRMLVDSNLSVFGSAKIGTTIGNFVGIFTHFESLSKGIVSGADILFFVIWTVIFLILNVLGLERRGRQHAGSQYAVAIGLLFAVGALMNVMFLDGSITLGRYDATADKIYTVSKESKKILGNLPDDVTVTYYVSRKDKLPDHLKTLERDVVDRLENLRLVSGGHLKIKVIDSLDPSKIMQNPFADKKDEKKKDAAPTIEERILKNIKPFPETVMRNDSQSQFWIYSSLKIAYRNNKEEFIPYVSKQVLGSEFERLEFKIVDKVYRMTREKKPVIAMVAPKSTIPPQLAAIYRQMGQNIPNQDPFKRVQSFLGEKGYEVKRVSLSADSPLPDKYDVLLVLGPKKLNERQRFEINKAMVAGKPTFIAVQKYSWNYSRSRTGIDISKTDDKPGMNEILAPTGVSINDGVLMEAKNFVPLTMGGSLADRLNPYPLPMHIIVPAGGMNVTNPISRKLSDIFYLWGSAIDVNAGLIAANKLKVTQLFSSSDESWLSTTGKTLVQEDITPEKNTDKMRSYPLALLIKGQIKNAFGDKPAPAWPPAPPAMPGRRPPPPPPADKGLGKTIDMKKAKPTQVILVGCGVMFEDRSGFGQSEGNTKFLLNSLDCLALGDVGLAILSLRDKSATSRTLQKPSDDRKRFWQAITYGVVYLVIAGVGVMVFILRTRRRNLYLEQNT